MMTQAGAIHWALAHPIAAALAGLIGLGVGFSLGELLVTAALAVVIMGLGALGAAGVLVSLGACLAWGECVRQYRKQKQWRSYRRYVKKERKRLKSGVL